MKDIRVEGTVQTTDDDIRQASGIQDSDYTINLLLDKAKYEEQIKSNYWVESAQLVYQFQPSLQSRLRNMILWPTMFLEKVIIQSFQVVSKRPVR